MIQYLIDNIPIEDFDVHVSKSKGVIGMPKPKERRRVEYADMNGAFVDTSKVVYEQREIVLDCFITKRGRIDMLDTFHRFIDIIDSAGTRRLTVALQGLEKKCLMFEVYNDGDVTAEPHWDDAQDLWTFTLKLVEARPLKMVILVHPASVQDGVVNVSIACDGIVDIHWGDGQHTIDVSGGDYKHRYEDKYWDKSFIVISGEIESISDIAINAEHEIIFKRV